MLLRLIIALLALSVSTLAQSYSGYTTPAGQTSTPLVSYKASAVLTCSAAFSSDPTNYPAGCYMNSWLLRLNQSVTAPSAGTGYLYCQGQAYLSCTLTVRNPGTPSPVSPPAPTPDQYQGSGWIGLGGGNQHMDGCNREGMKIEFPSTVTVTQATGATFSVSNFGGGFCSTTSGGYVYWGDGTRDEFPASAITAADSCAAAGTVRLNAGPYKLTHTYTVVGDFDIFAKAEGDFKDNGDPGGHTKGDLGNSGSWRCIEQKHQSVKVVALLSTSTAAQPVCRIKRMKGPCVKSSVSH